LEEKIEDSTKKHHGQVVYNTIDTDKVEMDAKQADAERRAAKQSEVVNQIFDLYQKQMEQYTEDRPSYIHMVFHSSQSDNGQQAEDLIGSFPVSRTNSAGSVKGLVPTFSEGASSLASVLSVNKRVGSHILKKTSKRASRILSRPASVSPRSNANYFSYSSRHKRWQEQLRIYLAEEEKKKVDVDKSKTVSAGCIMEDAAQAASPYPYPRRFQFESRDTFTKTLVDEVLIKRAPVVTLSSRKFLRSSTCVRPLRDNVTTLTKVDDSETESIILPQEPNSAENTTVAKPLVSRRTGMIEIPNRSGPVLYANNDQLDKELTLHTYDKTHSNRVPILEQIPSTIMDRVHGDENVYNRDLFVLKDGTLPDIDLRLSICSLNERTKKIQDQLEQIFLRQNRKEERQRKLIANEETTKFEDLKSRITKIAEQRYHDKKESRLKEFEEKSRKDKAAWQAFQNQKLAQQAAEKAAARKRIPAILTKDEKKDHVRKSVVPSHVISKKSKQLILLE
jgi:hypothetical protein